MERPAPPSSLSCASDLYRPSLASAPLSRREIWDSMNLYCGPAASSGSRCFIWFNILLAICRRWSKKAGRMGEGVLSALASGSSGGGDFFSLDFSIASLGSHLICELPLANFCSVRGWKLSFKRWVLVSVPSSVRTPFLILFWYSIWANSSLL